MFKPLSKGEEQPPYPEYIGDGSDVDIANQRNADETWPKLTKEELDAIEAYTSPDYSTINDPLRDSIRDKKPLNTLANMQTMEWIKGLESAIRKSPGLLIDQVLWRGFRNIPQTWQQKGIKTPEQVATFLNESKGKVIYEPEFISTTISKDIAAYFSAEGQTPILFRIRAPRGTQGLWLEGSKELGPVKPWAGNEGEVLLLPGTVMVIDKAEVRKNSLLGTYVFARIHAEPGSVKQDEPHPPEKQESILTASQTVEKALPMQKVKVKGHLQASKKTGAVHWVKQTMGLRQKSPEEIQSQQQHKVESINSKVSKQVWNHLSEHQRQVVDDYLHGSSAYNDPLRASFKNHAPIDNYMQQAPTTVHGEGGNPTVQDIYDMMDTIKSAPGLPMQQSLWRTIHGTPPTLQAAGTTDINQVADFFNQNKGRLLFDPGFISTSTDKFNAESFLGEVHTLMEIDAPKGTKALYVNPFGSWQEHEALMLAGYPLEITGAEVKQHPQYGYTYLHLKVAARPWNEKEWQETREAAGMEQHSGVTQKVASQTPLSPSVLKKAGLHFRPDLRKAEDKVSGPPLHLEPKMRQGYWMKKPGGMTFVPPSREGYHVSADEAQPQKMPATDIINAENRIKQEEQSVAQARQQGQDVSTREQRVQTMGEKLQPHKPHVEGSEIDIEAAKGAAYPHLTGMLGGAFTADYLNKEVPDMIKAVWNDVGARKERLDPRMLSGTQEAGEAVLKTTRLRNLDPIAQGGCNASFWAQNKDGTTYGVLKPAIAENRVLEHCGMQWRFEVMAYLFDRAMGLGVVPATISYRVLPKQMVAHNDKGEEVDSKIAAGIRKYRGWDKNKEQFGIVGSMQGMIGQGKEVGKLLHLDDMIVEQYKNKSITAKDLKTMQSQIQRIYILDTLLNNRDRHAGNVFFSADYGFSAIDNGLAMSQATYGRDKGGLSLSHMYLARAIRTLQQQYRDDGELQGIKASVVEVPEHIKTALLALTDEYTTSRLIASMGMPQHAVPANVVMRNAKTLLKRIEDQEQLYFGEVEVVNFAKGEIEPWTAPGFAIAVGKKRAGGKYVAALFDQKRGHAPIENVDISSDLTHY